MKTRPYFEGWYFKHQSNTTAIALIPGINIDRLKNPRCFIQIITGDASYYVEYPILEFKLRRNPLGIQIGNNYFSEKGMILDIDSPDIKLKGKIKYNNMITIAHDIMGPFQYVPFLECNHGILSLYHSLKGKLVMNGAILDFKNGTGYIEKDWGHSFPKKYLWTQCNDFGQEFAQDLQAPICGVMTAIAQIPICCFRFHGCICVIYYKGKQYRLATYLGARIIYYNQYGFELLQGKYRLRGTLLSENPKPLLAPNLGEMNSTVYEHLNCKARFEFFENESLLFDLTSSRTSFETF